MVAGTPDGSTTLPQATSCGFLPHDGRPRSRQSTIIDNSKAIFRSVEPSLLVGEDIVVE